MPAPPEFTSVTPATGLSTGGTAIVVVGANLSNPVVTIGGRACAITSNNGVTIHALAPIGEYDTTKDLVITTPGGSVTANDAFAYVNGFSIASVVPSEASIFGGTLVTVTLLHGGASLVEYFRVSGSADYTDLTVLSDTQFSFTDRGSSGPDDPLDVLVGAGDFGSAEQLGAISHVSPIVIDSVSPDVVSLAGGETITITGRGFLLTPMDTARICGARANLTIVDDNTATCTAPAGDYRNGGLCDLEIGLYDPIWFELTTFASKAACIQLEVQIASGLPGTSVHDAPAGKSFTGQGFTGVTGVIFDFGSYEATGLVIDSDGALHFTSPELPPDTYVPQTLYIALRVGDVTIDFGQNWTFT